MERGENLVIVFYFLGADNGAELLLHAGDVYHTVHLGSAASGRSGGLSEEYLHAHSEQHLGDDYWLSALSHSLCKYRNRLFLKIGLCKKSLLYCVLSMESPL